MPRRRRARRLVAAPLLAAVLGLNVTALAADDAATPPDRVIRYENDTLTVHIVRMPVTEVLSELEQQTGATVRGSLLDPREVSADFKAVPLAQALARLLGDQNFALVYGEGGRLRVINLLPGGQVAAVPRPMAATPPTTVPPQSAVTLEEFAQIIDSQPPVKCDGQLAEALGPVATYRQLLETALSHSDASLRMLAVGVAIRSIEGQPELRSKLVGAAAGVEADHLSQLIESAAGNRAQEFASNVTAQTRATEVRAKFSTALHHLRRRGAGAGG
jgi:hypothetical protein